MSCGLAAHFQPMLACNTKSRRFASNPLAWVKKWKDSHHKKVIGCLPMYTPEEIVAAADMLPVTIPGRDAPIILANAYLHSNLCHPARGNFELALSGELKFMDGLVFPDICDQTKRLANVWRLYYRTGFFYSLWLPKRLDTPSAKEFYTQLINGKSVGECVRLSRLRLIKEYGIMGIHWASYLLYGDPSFVLFRAKAKPAALKLKKSISFYKKRIAWASLALVLISMCIYLYMWLPSINPNTYLLFLRSQKLFQKGNNPEVILQCSRIIKRDPLFLAAYPQLAATYRRIGDRENALKYYFDYAFYSEKKGDKKNLASAYLGIGWFYHLDGEYTKAFDFYNKAITLTRDTKDKLNEADALGKLAVWYIDRQDNDKALELLTKSSEINRQRLNISKHRYNLACDYFNLGLLFTNKDDFTTAKEFYEKSFNLFSQLKLTDELSDYYFNIGEIYKFQKEYQKAMACYQKGLKIDEMQDNKINIASDNNMLGELYAELDKYKEAENFFNQAVLISKQINARPELASGYYNLGLLYKKIGKPNKAREYLRQAQEIYRLIDESLYREIKQELLGLR